MKNSYFLIKFISIILISLITVIVSPFFGIKLFTFSDLVNNPQYANIFFSIRIPRTVTSFVAGGGLAMAGMVCQALFRNPLASPYTLGISGGASLGAALVISLGLSSSFFGISFTTLGAFVGAIGAIMLVYIFAWSKESNSITLLLAGVIVSTVSSGLIWFVHYITPMAHSYQITRWVMGGLDGVSGKMLLILIIPITLYGILTGLMLPTLDQFLTGDSIAHSRGVNVKQARLIFILTTALATGAIVSICGPIGFIGIMAPHACRLILPGIRHRILAISSFLLGGAFLTFSDMLARTIAPPSEIPVGIITALFGGPFFLIILFKNKGKIQL